MNRYLIYQLISPYIGGELKSFCVYPIYPLPSENLTMAWASRGAEQAPQRAHEQSRRLSLRGGGPRAERWRGLQDPRRSASLPDGGRMGMATRQSVMIWGFPARHGGTPK